MIFDNSEGEHELIAEKKLEDKLLILNEIKYSQFKNYYEKRQ